MAGGASTTGLAAVVTYYSQSNPAFAVSGSDLLQTSVAAVTDGLFTGAYNTEAGGFTAAVLTNGGFGAADAGGGFVIYGGSITYTLDTTANSLGYDITGIDTYAGWNDTGRDNQDYTVSYSTVSDPATWLPIATIHYVPPSKLNKVSISNFVASGVKAIKFEFPGQENGAVGYKELDVIGVPSVPTSQTADYAGWALYYHLAGGPDSDDDHDGLTNLEEYSLGLIPNSVSTYAFKPVLSRLDGPGGKLTYLRPETTSVGLDYSISVSPDLYSWVQDTGAVQTVTAALGGVEIVEALVSPAYFCNPALFVRVRVVVPGQ